MKTKRIYLLRHGETDYNKNGMVQGRGINASLNENGRMQAQSAKAGLSEVPFDRLFTSSLVRTHETIAPFESEFTALDGFDEISWGNQEGVKATLEERTIYADTINNWKRGNLDLNIGGGETPIEVMTRQKAAFAEVENQDCNNVLICMHGRAMRIMLCWMLNYPLNYMDGFPHQNCAFYSLIQTGNSFYLNHFNETSHLNG